ncbi:MAG: sulfatase [Candidatus Solibacter sp.]
MKQWGSASAHGALVGLIYGLFEYALLIVAAMIRWRPTSLVPDHWMWTAVFLAIYIVLGAVAGRVAAMFRWVESPRGAARLVVAVVALVLASGRVIVRGTTVPDLVVGLFFVLFAGLIIVSLFARWKSAWISWITSPWVSFPLILCVSKMSESSSGAASLSAAIMGACASVFLLSFVASRILGRTSENHFLPAGVYACGALAAGLVCITLWVDAAPGMPPAPAAATARGRRPNVLLIVLDTVRADHLSLYGYARRTSPNLEAWAKEGVLFRNAISASDMTLSTHGSLFTGLYPSWHRARLVPQHGAEPLDPSFHTLAEILSENGYTSMAMLANCAYLRPVFHLDQGFKVYDVRTPIGGLHHGRAGYLRDFIQPVLAHWVSTDELYRAYRRADQITDDGLRIFRSMRERPEPFFLNLNYMDAHDPYIPPPPYRDLFPGRNPAFALERVGQLHRELARLERPPTLAADLAHITSQYDGAIAYIDAEIKRLLDGLKQAGFYDNTLVIVTSDHGEAIRDRSALGHPASVYQDLVHVPLLIKYPRSLNVAEGQQVDSPVSSVDVLPTVLDAAGIRLTPDQQGESLRTMNPHTDRAVFSESFPDSLSLLRRRQDVAQRALFQGGRKLIVSSTGEAELYNLSQDPTESQNLYSLDDPAARLLNSALESWLQQIPRVKLKDKKLDRQTLERLKSLGYVQ